MGISRSVANQAQADEIGFGPLGLAFYDAAQGSQTHGLSAAVPRQRSISIGGVVTILTVAATPSDAPKAIP